MNHEGETKLSELSADPEGMNDRRSAWADAAIRTFQSVTGANEDDALGDLLTDLMHWSDRNQFDFNIALDRARWHYEAETEEIDGDDQVNYIRDHSP